MTSSSRFHIWAHDLAIAAKTLSEHSQEDGTNSTPRLIAANGASDEVDRARRSILSIATQLQASLVEPADFIQQLASQNQLLACLRWLGEFQVLACIPLNSSIPAKDVADLAAVPEMQLCRIVRMMATAGFLHEPQPGHIAHTTLSAPFVTNLSFLDAAMFLAETAAPTALHMAAATQRHTHEEGPKESAYSIAFKTLKPFTSSCAERSRLQRQWSAYRRCTGDVDDSIADLLDRLNWRSLGSACVVDACAPSTEAAIALAELYPALHFIVQMIEPPPPGNETVATRVTSDVSRRITVQKRLPAAVQVVEDASVYILRLTPPTPWSPTQILPELRAHLNVLRANPVATLIMAPPSLPEPGTVDPPVEAMARLRDLSRLQLTNEVGMELDSLIDMISSVYDGTGRLVVVNKLRSRQSATTAIGVRYRAFADDPSYQTLRETEGN